MNIELGLLGVKSLHFCLENGVDVFELILVGAEPQREEAQTELEELVVVFAVKHGVLHIAHEVLEETSDYDVDDLANLEIHCRFQRRPHVELLELHATRDILLSTGLVQLVQCRVRETLAIQGATEVERHVVH